MTVPHGKMIVIWFLFVLEKLTLYLAWALVLGTRGAMGMDREQRGCRPSCLLPCHEVYYAVHHVSQKDQLRLLHFPSLNDSFALHMHFKGLELFAKHCRNHRISHLAAGESSIQKGLGLSECAMSYLSSSHLSSLGIDLPWDILSLRSAMVVLFLWSGHCHFLWHPSVARKRIIFTVYSSIHSHKKVLFLRDFLSVKVI